MEFSTDRTMLMASIQPLDLAKRLGLNAISVIEMGVAGAKGLLALEGIAKTAGANFGQRIHVTGFDSGQGCLRRPTFDLSLTGVTTALGLRETNALSSIGS